MLFNRYYEDKRTNIIIVSQENEPMSLPNNEEEDSKILDMLERKYNETLLANAPYHYVVKANGCMNVKSTDLIHFADNFLKAFNNDIVILLYRDRYLKQCKDSIVNLIADISSKYSIPLKDSLLFIKRTISADEQSLLETIELEAIKKRNLQKPEMAVYEAVIGNDVIVNEDIFMVSNRIGYSTLSSFAGKFLMPIEVLINLNPHLNPNYLRNTDTIFIPNTTSIKGLIRECKIEKEANYIYDECKHLIESEVNSNE